MLETFKFPNLFNVLLGFAAWLLFSFVITVAVFLSNGFLDGMCALLIVGPAFWFVFIYAIANSLDVVVDDCGLKRCFYGRVWYSLEWDNVKLIRKSVKKISDRDGSRHRDAIYINVYPMNGVVYFFSPHGSMKFSYHMAGFDQFIEMLNGFASSRNFKLEEIIEGKRMPITSL